MEEKERGTGVIDKGITRIADESEAEEEEEEEEIAECDFPEGVDVVNEEEVEGINSFELAPFCIWTSGSKCC